MSGLTGQQLAKALFEPRAVALVGASADPNKNTGRPQRFMARHGYKGTVVPINPRREEVQGVRAYPSVTAAPGPIDHALIMVPTRSVSAALEDCADAGVPMVTIFTDGFADAGAEGKAHQEALAARARERGVRLLGPNCMGVMNLHSGSTLSVNAVLEMPEVGAGPLSFISQSGSLLGTLLSRGSGRGFGFSKLVSVGNECDLGVGELVDCLVDDADTGAILLFLEALRDAPALAHAARRAYRAGKPVLAYKLGESEVGRALAATHSGAIAGGAAAARAFFEAHGIVQVESLETLFEAPALFASRPQRRDGAVSVMTTTGGGAATVVDRLGQMGVTVRPAGDELARALATHGIDVAGKPLVDLTMAGTRPEVFQQALQGLLDEPETELVVVVVGSSGQFHPELTVEPIVAANRAAKPVAVFILPEAGQSLRLLADAGIAAFRTPESCGDAVRAYLSSAPPKAVLEPGEPASDALDLAGIEALLEPVAGRGEFDEFQAGRIFERLGIARPRTVALDSLEALDQKIAGLEFPVVAKLLSREVTHKTDVGGVALRLANIDELRAACERIGRSVAGHVKGPVRFLVQEMAPGLAEVVLGYRNDAEVGPVVSVGAGGVLAEIYRDVAMALAPVDEATALELIERVQGLALVRGFRGLPRGDIAALARAIVAFSQLALVRPVVREAEINPLLVMAERQGVLGVDAVLVVESPGLD